MAGKKASYAVVINNVLTSAVYAIHQHSYTRLQSSDYDAHSFYYIPVVPPVRNVCHFVLCASSKSIFDLLDADNTACD